MHLLCEACCRNEMGGSLQPMLFQQTHELVERECLVPWDGFLVYIWI
jgi:hypothetical protein